MDMVTKVLDICLAAGLPALGGVMWVGFKTILDNLKAVKSGTQASLRNQMIQMWETYSRMGYAPIYVKDDFENVYQNYHKLGANGVMDDLREKFLALPTELPEHPKRRKTDI